MKTNKLDSFEQFVQETLSSEEVAYNPSDWNELSQRLDAVAPKPFYKSKWFLGGAAVAVLGLSSIAFYTNSEKEIVQPKSIVQAVEENKNSQPNLIVSDVENSNSQENEETIIRVEKDNQEIKENHTSSETIEKKKTTGDKVNENHQPPQNTLSSETSSNSQNEYSGKYSEEVAVVKPKASFVTETKLSGCKELTVAFKAKEQEDVKYMWSFGDGQFSDEINPTHKYVNSGTYKVELIVQSTVDSKVMQSSVPQFVVVHEDPIVELVSNKEMDRGLTTVSYKAVGEDLEKVFWNFGNGKSSDKLEATTTYKKRGAYTVQLEAVNSYGCKSITKESIFVEQDYNLLAPNAFTPDGDGLNDVFIPEALKTMNCNFTMVIRGRTEGIVFETTSLDRPWDGKNQQNGIECQETNYVWVVNLINELGEKEQYTGTILIRR